MFNTPAGAAQALGLPATVSLAQTYQNASSGNVGSVSLGAYEATRATIVAAAARTDTAAAITATLGGVSMTNVINQLAFSGINPSALLILDTGEGTAFESLTTASLIITGPGTIQRVGGGVFQALNLSSLTPAHTATSTATNASMNLNKYRDGISVAGGYVGDETSRTWSGLANSMTAPITGQFTSNPLGYETVSADALPQALTISPIHDATTQRGFEAASWRGTLNP